MKAVVSQVQLKEALPDDALAASVEDLSARVRTIEGFQGLQVVRIGGDRLVLVITGDDEAALDRIRDEAGNAWMREHVVPRAAGPPDRQVGDVLVDIPRAATHSG